MMVISSRAILEVAIPIIAVFVFIGGYAFSMPPSLEEWLRTTFNTEGKASILSVQTQPFTQKNLDWALETLSTPTAESLRSCPKSAYTTYIYSTDPPILYIENFLSPSEVEQLTQLAEGHYAAATIFRAADGGEANDTTIRHSEKAPLSRTNELVPCIEERARALQGWRPDVFVEKLWAQRYGPGGHYAPHYDWNSDGGARGGRVSSFMAWLNDGFGGGGTHFPRVEPRRDREWCERIDCEQSEGTTWRPRKGSAVYWENFRRRDGVGYEQSWHAGLPVTEGEKIGLNIWSWWQPGLEEAMEEEKKRRQRESAL